MPIPTLDGVPCFGSQCSVTTSPRDRATYDQSYFGSNGLGYLDGGGRGFVSQIVGMLWGFGPEGLAQAEAQVRAFIDGVGHTFRDSNGTTWTDTLLLNFNPLGRVIQSHLGACGRRYRAAMLHLAHRAPAPPVDPIPPPDAPELYASTWLHLGSGQLAGSGHSQGQSVAELVDHGPDALTFTPQAHLPTYGTGPGGLPVLDYAPAIVGTPIGWTAPIPSGRTYRDIWIIAKLGTLSPVAALYTAPPVDLSIDVDSLSAWPWTDGVIYPAMGRSYWGPTFPSTSPMLDWGLWRFQIDPSATTISFNNEVKATNSTGTGITPTSLQIGLSTALPRYFVGSIGEVALCGSPLTNTEAEAMSAYFAQKWGLSLP